jgi:hypothetical protein
LLDFVCCVVVGSKNKSLTNMYIIDFSASYSLGELKTALYTTPGSPLACKLLVENWTLRIGDQFRFV